MSIYQRVTFGRFLKNQSKTSPVTLKKGLPAVTFEEGFEEGVAVAIF